jgi:spore coat polysaccharide biosynthesis protein SpsF (cytidylyltransferase family)
MRKKIIITGGLGYIGTELCKLYSGVSWNNTIIVIDNRFISERVNQIRNWNMEFVHGDILDKELINKYFKDADIVHHLAGITDVPRVKSETNTERDNKIKLIAQKKKVKIFCGSENNVLKRYLECSQKFNLQNIIHITSDCPLVDPILIKRMQKIFISKLFYLQLRRKRRAARPASSELGSASSLTASCLRQSSPQKYIPR